MREVECRIGDYVKKNPIINPVNSWRITVEFMHGDADHYSTDTFDFDNISGGELFHQILDTFISFTELGWNEACRDYRSKLRYASDEVRDSFSDNLTWDLTYRDFPASPNTITVTYWDSNSLEHEVDIISNGKTYKSLYRNMNWS